MISQYETTKWTQKDVLIVVQKSLHDKKPIILPSANWSGLDLRGINLRNANLKFANLSNCNFTSADFDGANLRFADLTNSVLSNCRLVSCELTDANCIGARFDGANGMGSRFMKKWNISEPEPKMKPTSDDDESKQLTKSDKETDAKNAKSFRR